MPIYSHNRILVKADLFLHSTLLSGTLPSEMGQLEFLGKAPCRFLFWIPAETQFPHQTDNTKKSTERMLLSDSGLSLVEIPSWLFRLEKLSK